MQIQSMHVSAIIELMIKGIFFDYDGTLSSRYECAYHMYRDCLSHICPDMDPDSLDFEMIVQECMYWDQFGIVTKKYVWQNLKDKYLPDLDVGKMFDYWHANFHKNQKLIPGAMETLLELKKEYRIGILTNGAAESQYAKVKAAGLDTVVDCVVTSGTYGIQKPDPRIYKIAAEKLGFSCEETAYVGDTFFTDVAGAIRAGMFPVWFSYEKRTISNYDVTRAENFEEIRNIFLNKKL